MRQQAAQTNMVRIRRDAKRTQTRLLIVSKSSFNRRVGMVGYWLGRNLKGVIASDYPFGT
jgi:hypothetical protein